MRRVREAELSQNLSRSTGRVANRCCYLVIATLHSNLPSAKEVLGCYGVGPTLERVQELHFWERGDHVLYRDVFRQTVRSVVPMTVVSDTADVVALYLRPGTSFCLSADRHGELTKNPDEMDSLKLLTWNGFEQLLLARRGEAHAVILRWSDSEREFVEWYVNLQAPLIRTQAGFDTTDHVLDLVLSPDLTEFHWKDAGELQDMVRRGYFSEAEAASFRSEGESVLMRARTLAPPFGESWERWRPDPDWTIPLLPEDWIEIPTT